MFNESEHIQRTINSALTAAEHANLDCTIIAVDNNSTDNSRELAKELGASVITLPNANIGALRNTGAKTTDCDYVAFLDADIEVPDRWLVSCLQQHAKNYDVIALDCDTPKQAPWFAKVWQKRNMSLTGNNRVLAWLATPNLFLTNELFNATGGFNPSLKSGEDKEFGLRLNSKGAKQISLAQPTALHWGYEKTWPEWFRKEFWRQSSHVQLIKQEPSLRLLRFPALCLITTFATILLVVFLSLNLFFPSIVFLILSITPPALLASRQSKMSKDPSYTIKLSLLHWLRLHIGCAALLTSILKKDKQES